MRHYEIMIILDASLEEDAIGSLIDRATESVRSNGGNPVRVERWGKRRFAYELDHRWEGYYVLLSVTAEPGALADLDRMLSFADEVLRHKVVRVPAVAAARRAASPENGTVIEAS